MSGGELRHIIRSEIANEENRRMDARHRAQDAENQATGRLVCWLLAIALVVNLVLMLTGWDKYIP